MDEGTRASGPAVEPAPATEAPERSPEEIRRDIEQTREDLGDTVEALAHKTDVKAQARERIDSIKLKAKATTEKAKAKTPDSASGGARQVTETAKENPLPFAIGVALLTGFLIGRISSR
jgi:ElaB/YqjD/DUF883 family membrane-anchored ribosome-binding protein